MKRRLPPKPEQPPEGYVWNPAPWIWYGKFIHGLTLVNLSQEVMRQYDTDVRSNPYIVKQLGVSELHKYAMLPWNQDPSYNWRRNGPRPRKRT